MRRLIQFFVNNYVLTISVFGALMLFGAVSIVSRGIELFPPITVPVIAVTTSCPTAPATPPSRSSTPTTSRSSAWRCRPRGRT